MALHTEKAPHVRAPTQRAEITDEIESGEPTKLGEALEKLDASGPTALDEDELRAFTHFANRHPDVPWRTIRTSMSKNLRKLLRKSGSLNPARTLGMSAT